MNRLRRRLDKIEDSRSNLNLNDLSEEERDALCPDLDDEIIPGRTWRSLSHRELEDAAKGILPAQDRNGRYDLS